MLFDPTIVLEEPFKLLVVAAIIMIGKTVAAVVLVCRSDIRSTPR